MRASHLLLTFEQHLDITRQRAVAGQQGFQGHYLREVLPFVITHSSRIEASLAYRWLKGRETHSSNGSGG